MKRENKGIYFGIDELLVAILEAVFGHDAGDSFRIELRSTSSSHHLRQNSAMNEINGDGRLTWRMSRSEYSSFRPLTYFFVPLMITIRAGRLTPTASVEVAPIETQFLHYASWTRDSQTMLIEPLMNPSSINRRSLLSIPAW